MYPTVGCTQSSVVMQSLGSNELQYIVLSQTPPDPCRSAHIWRHISSETHGQNPTFDDATVHCAYVESRSVALIEAIASSSVSFSSRHILTVEGMLPWQNSPANAGPVFSGISLQTLPPCAAPIPPTTRASTRNPHALISRQRGREGSGEGRRSKDGRVLGSTVNEGTETRGRLPEYSVRGGLAELLCLVAGTPPLPS